MIDKQDEKDKKTVVAPVDSSCRSRVVMGCRRLVLRRRMMVALSTVLHQVPYYTHYRYRTAPLMVVAGSGGCWIRGRNT